MSDDNPRNPGRTEPTLEGPTGKKPSSATGASSDGEAKRDTSEQLNHERRDERRHVRVDVPFEARFADGSTLTGHDLSLGGFSVYSDTPMQADQVMSVSLLLVAGAAELIVPVDAKVLREHGEKGSKQHEVAFEITRIERRHRELLRRVIRAYLSGNHASVENLVDSEDPQTPRKRKTATPAQAKTKSRKPWGRYAALLLAAVTLVAVAAATAYRNFMLIEPDFAAVTAPRIDVLAPGAGQLSEHSLQPGDKVQRDERLAKVINSDLQSELIQAKAAHNYNSRLIENMRERINDAGSQQISMAQSTTPSNGRPPSFETVSPEVAKIRIKQFVQARDYEQSRVDALQTRSAANVLYSPCNCVVAWALGSSGETFINKGDRIMTLVRTGNNDIMVEALVHMSQIGDIQPHQKAYIALPNASEPIPARVRSVALDVERQPRAGFPEWVRQQQNVASVLLVPEEPLSASDVGKPVDVRFSEVPFIDNTAEWVWQGARAAAQQVEQWFDTALNKATAQVD
ncbi:MULTISPECIES: alginate biosynthesis protein Alg44 [unclassified Modicisalibacter]|uniref:HlyD family efflux transporter periplasmic adaptor subunit n=1 Tax=unclassified Modicisalibacter TaxID=2679913 RepID=UPI001CC96102|nr:MULTISPECIES: alginate biosynthesis protein Alg44 [unclassified Modicisalibacter]MBZ9557416.1 alginate biosynthesis protein Alg44 [Modicisalibacter sp. R2A 31.J]MBZ9573918.1 alginate biosynthesis protein Alg44 [Modicisalibacter sp. MOD 31.J]